MSKTAAKKKVFAAGGKEPLAMRIIKYLMLSLFGYGVVFWGGTGVLAAQSLVATRMSYEQFKPIL